MSLIRVEKYLPKATRREMLSNILTNPTVCFIALLLLAIIVTCNLATKMVSLYLSLTTQVEQFYFPMTQLQGI